MMEYLYWLLHVLGLVIAMAYLYAHAPMFKLPRIPTVFCGAAVYASSYGLMLLLYGLVTGQFGGQNVIRVMIFIPVFTLFFAKVFDLPRRPLLDLFAPVVCLSQAIAKPGCQFVGCCRSWLETPFGIRNRITGTTLFPVQLAEGLTALVLGIVLIVKGCRQKQHDGHLMAEMLFWFGLTRIGWEYLRESAKYFLGFSELAVWALLMTICGLVWLLVNRRKTHERSKKDAV